MLKFLSRYIVAIHVALVSCAFAWIFGGMIGQYTVEVMPWFWAFLLESLLVFPEHHTGESTYAARERVWGNLKRDPLTWLSVVFLVCLCVAFFNPGLCPICDYPAIAAGAKAEPFLPFAPFCVNRLEHLSVVMWFGPALTAMLAVKHGLLKGGKRIALEMIVWNGTVLTTLGVVQQVTGATGPFWVESDNPWGAADFFSSFGYANAAGDYFTTLFALSVALWRWKCDEVNRETSETREGTAEWGHQHFWRKHYMVIPAGMAFFSAIATLSRAAIMISSVLAVLFFLHAMACLFVRLHRAQRVKMLALGALVLVAVALAGLMYLPSTVRREVNTVESRGVLDRMTGKGQYHVAVATRIWRDNPLFGVGGWGYKHFCLPYMKESDGRGIQVYGGVNVHNDHLQFLAEHGVVGMGLLVTIVVLLIMPVVRYWRRIMPSLRFTKGKTGLPRPLAIFAVPAPVFCVLCGVAGTVVHAFGDCPMRSPAVLTLFFVSLSALGGFIPRITTGES